MGCYQTVPLVSSTPPAGAEVEVRLTDAASSSLGQLMGPGAETVRGHFEGSAADTIRLSVIGVTRRDGREDFWKGEHIGLSRSDIATMGQRKISRERTGVLIAAGVAALGLVKLGFDGRTNTTGTRRPPPPTQ
jgi:hypothetical protein